MTMQTLYELAIIIIKIIPILVDSLLLHSHITDIPLSNALEPGSETSRGNSEITS